jgi:hypothetical protein
MNRGDMVELKTFKEGGHDAGAEDEGLLQDSPNEKVFDAEGQEGVSSAEMEATTTLTRNNKRKRTRQVFFREMALQTGSRARFVSLEGLTLWMQFP